MANITKDDRARTWCAIVYPESAPENWRELLDEQHISWACSPLHDKDLNPTGEVKKPHWHIVLSFQGKKSFEQVCELLKPVKSPIPQRCGDIRGAVRYFVHLDNPDKAQYSKNDIRAFGGFDVEDALKLSKSEETQVLKDILKFAREQNLREYSTLGDYILDMRPEWFDVYASKTIFLDAYLRSARNRKSKTNFKTGEIESVDEN